MTRADLQQQFLAFRDSGDPRAIAAVYDEVAPELLLVAAHLGNRGEDAEDLVQATFLAAMGQAHAYDAARPLLPWLVGILINQCRYERRRRRRQPDAARLPVREAEDPVALAAQAELAEELARRLQQLPEYYRQVLTLRLVHGIRVVDIAHSLGLPPETVKTRLRRGHELLRRAMPAGFAGAFAGMLTAAPGLPRVREAVLARAAELQAIRTAAPATASGSGVAPLPALAVLGALVLAGSLFVWAWPGHPAVEPVAAAPRDGAPAAEPTEAPAAAGERTPVASDVPAGRAALTLRLRWWNGEPAAGAHAVVVADHLADPQLHEVILPSDRHGVVELADAAPGAYRVRVLRGGGTLLVTLAPGERTSHELTIPRGIDLRGRVVGAGGTALPGARILLSAAAPLDELHAVATADERGAFLLPSVAPGRSLSAQHAGHAALPLQLVTGAPGESRELILDLADSRSAFALRGQVTGADGAPLAGALVQVGPRLPFLDFASAAMGPEMRRPPVLLRTDAEGRFAVLGLVVTDRQIDVFARAAGHPLWHRVVAFDGVEAEVPIRLAAGRSISGRVVDEGGAPRAGAEVVARPDLGATRWDLAPTWGQSACRADAQGEYHLPAASREALDLQANARDGHRAVARLAGGGDSRWDPILVADGSIAGTVVGPDGQGIAGLKVSALVPHGGRAPTPTRTDERGRFRIDGCAACDHSLWIVDPASPWSGCLASRAAVRPRGADEHFLVPEERLPTAAIRGRVVDAGGAPLAARIALRSLRVGAGHTLTDPATGAFAFASIPALPCGYSLFVFVQRDRWARLCHVPVRVGETTDAGDVVVSPCGGVDLTVALADGTPVEDAEVHIHHAEGPFAELARIRRGRGRNDALAPGRYVLHVRGAGLAPSPALLEVHSGERTPSRLTVQPGIARSIAFAHQDDGWDLRLELDWCDAAGQRLFGETVQLPHTRGLQVERDFAPGAYTLRARSDSGRSAELQFQVTDRPTPDPLHLTLE